MEKVHGTHEAIQYLDKMTSTLQMELSATKDPRRWGAQDLVLFRLHLLESRKEEKVFVVIRINTAFSGRKRCDLMHGVLSLWLQPKVRQLTLCLQRTGIHHSNSAPSHGSLGHPRHWEGPAGIGSGAPQEQFRYSFRPSHRNHPATLHSACRIYLKELPVWLCLWAKRWSGWCDCRRFINGDFGVKWIGGLYIHLWLNGKQEGKTPLIVACLFSGFSNVAKTLIELGANVNAYRPRCHAGIPLHLAANSIALRNSKHISSDALLQLTFDACKVLTRECKTSLQE